MFIAGTNIFTQQALKRLEHAQLEAQDIASIRGSMDVLRLEHETIARKLDAVSAEVDALATQSSRLAASIESKKNEAHAPFEIGGVKVATVAAVAVGIVAVVGTGGAAVGVVGAVAAAGAELDALNDRDWKKTDKLEAEADKAAAGVQKVIEKGKVVYAQAKILTETEEAESAQSTRP